MDNLMNLLFDKSFLITFFVGILAFATVVTLGVPLLETNGLDDRLKSVARRREELRAKHHAALNAKRGALRIEPTSYMKATLDRFKLGNILEGENSRVLYDAGLLSRNARYEISDHECGAAIPD